MEQADLAAQGWRVVDDTGFLGLVGPLWQREVGDRIELAIETGEKHRNRSGVVQGGAICTLADRAIGTAARLSTGSSRVVTLKLDTTFLARAEIGALLVARPTIHTRTRSLVIGEADIYSGERLSAKIASIFKVVEGKSPSGTGWNVAPGGPSRDGASHDMSSRRTGT